MSSSDGTPPHGVLPASLWARLDGIAGLSQMIRLAAWYHLRYIWERLRVGRISALFNHHDILEHGFAEFYQAVAHNFAAYEATTAVPSLVASAHGVVLDLGPGTGIQLGYFTPSRVEHVYGVEPNTAFAPGFADRLAETSLGQDAKYTLIPCGVEDGETLARYGVVEGSVDCVVSMQVLCSIPDAERQVQHMYRLLKPGGELIFWEHCRSADPVTRAVQWLSCLVWPVFIGGCRLDRVTKEALVRAADWEKIEIETEMLPEDPMPRVWGRLVKPRAA